MQLNFRLISWCLIGGGGFYFLYAISDILLPFTVGIFVAYALNPAVEKLTKYGLPRAVASLLLILSFLIIFISLLIYAMPFLKTELLRFPGLATQYWKKSFDFAQPYITELNQYVDIEDLKGISNHASEYASRMLNWAFRFLSNMLTNTMAITNLISMIVLMPLIAFYLLRDWKKILSYLKTLLPKNQAKELVSLGKQINDTLGGYVRGQATVCFILAIYYIVGLYIVDLDFAFTVGAITGLLAFIPYVGLSIGLAAGMVFALTQFDDGFSIALVALVFALGSILEGYVLAPKLIGDKVGLHPVWIIFSLLAGGSLFGFAGILTAIPAAAVIGVIVRHCISLYLKSSLYKITPPPTVKKGKDPIALSSPAHTES